MYYKIEQLYNYEKQRRKFMCKEGAELDKLEVKTDASVINVIDEFDYSTQSDSYNQKFIAWRRNKKNPFAYNFTINKKESVYIDGQGFVSDSAAADAEASVMSNVMRLVGEIMLIVAACELFFGKLLVQILDLLGMDIHNSFFNFVIYGGYKEVLAVLMIIALVKCSTALTAVQLKLKMPSKIAFPMQLNDAGELIASLAATLIVSGVLSIPAAYSHQSIEFYSLSKGTSSDISLWAHNEFVIYIIFDTIVISVLYELLFRGPLFTALRQFGDIFAVIVTSVVSGLVVMDFRLIPGTIAISAVAAIGMLRSGTIFTAIAVRIVYRLYRFGLILIAMDASSDMLQTRNIYIALVFVLGIIIFAAVFSNSKRREKKAFARYTGHISLKKRLTSSLNVFLFSASAVLCIIITIAYEVV